MSDIRQIKRDLRQIVKARRDQAHADNPDIAEELRDQALLHLSLPPHSIIASYNPYGSEIEPSALAEALRAAGHIIVLPVVMGDGLPLTFRRYNTGDPTASNNLGIGEPLATAETMTPDVLLVPLLAFDKHCQRLGYGGGFYDRTIKQLRLAKALLTIGIAFACQEVPEVPRGAHDVRLDCIITETRTFKP